MEFKCGICGAKLSTHKGQLRKHIEEIHKLNFENYLRTYHPELGGYCGVCGKPTKFLDFSKGFRSFCSNRCGNIGSKEKRKKTMIKKYGTEIPAKSLIIQEKMKNTMLERYGVENAFQSKEIQEKIKKKNKEKYGVDYLGQSPEIKEKKKQTCLEKYGVENPSQSLEIKEKKKQTCINHYGVKHISQAPEIKEKKKYSSIPYRFSLHEEVCKRLDIVILESQEEWYHKEFDLDIHTHRFHCNIHNLDFETKLFADRNLCPECRKAMYSKGEREVGDYIESLGIPIIRNDRSMIKPKEIDIWIPSRNIGIEYNGEYWHQDQSRDQEKKLLCESKRIRLFTIWDTEWNKNKEGVKEYLKKLLV